MDRLTGRVILITGSTGIAEAAALHCSGEGATVFVVSRTPDNARALAERMTAAGGQAGWAAADLTQEVETNAAVKAAFDPSGLLNPGKNIPTLHRCAEFGAMHVHMGQLPFPELERF